MSDEADESSAAPADLQEFVDGVSGIRRTFNGTLDELETSWSKLAAGHDYAPYTNPIEDSRGIATRWGERQDFVATVREAFVEADSYDPDAPAGSVITIPSSSIEALLERTTSERIEDFEDDLIASGVPEAEAAKIAANAEDLLEADPSLIFSDAIVQAAADHAGVTVEEYEQRLRALQMPRSEAAQILEENFEQVAERTGDSDTISIKDLQEIIADPTVDQEVRDAAFKIAADADLFLGLDTAAQTEVIASLDGVNRDGSDHLLPGQKSHEIADGEISRKDLEQFPEKDFLIDTVSAWLPAIDTANEDYDIGKSDGNITKDDVDAFLADESIPEHVRIAVYQTFERQFVLRNRAHYGLGAATILEYVKTAPPVAPKTPGGPKPTAPAAPKPTGPAGPKGGGPRGGGPLLAAIIGWEVGNRVAPELFPNVNKDTAIRVRDPITGNPTTIDGTILERYPTDQRTAVIQYIIATGKPPPPEFDPTEKRRWTYLHPKTGEWRFADNNELVPGHPPAPTYIDPDGIWRHATTGEPVDGPSDTNLDSEKVKPEIPFKAPHRRHRPSPNPNSKPHGDENTIISSEVDVAADVDAINSGNAVKFGDEWHVNGRIYKDHGVGDRLYPISGEGLAVLTRADYKAYVEVSRVKGDISQANPYDPQFTPDRLARMAELWKRMNP